ncbi:MAG: ATP-binding protein [Haloarculaceae archaeon]
MVDQSDRPIRVLYADGDAPVAGRTAAALERERDRFDVVTEPTAEDALDRLERGGIDCVVSGYRLPGTDGIEFLETVRVRYPDLPFVLFVREGDESVAAAAVSADASAYVRNEPGEDRCEELADQIASAVEDRRGGPRERDADGRPCAPADSTDSLAELRDKANLLDQLFEQLPVSLYVKDSEGRHLYMSEYDLAPDEAIGKTDPEIYGDDEFARRTYADDMRVIETGEPIINEEEYNEANDEWTLTSKVPWYGEDGEIKGLIGVTRFITEKKEYEREVERKNERLERFASVVSHDLRNPLDLAKGYVELLKEDYDDSRLERVDAAVDRMDALIDDILELARKGQEAFDPERVSLSEVTERARSNVETGGMAVRVDDDAEVYADEPRLVELLENLIANAREHGGASAVTVGVLSDGDGFYVADDGTGIPSDERDDVFRPGYTTSDEGTGFGLGIVTEIAEGHGWTVEVTDSDEGGARFEVTGAAFPPE